MCIDSGLLAGIVIGVVIVTNVASNGITYWYFVKHRKKSNLDETIYDTPPDASYPIQQHDNNASVGNTIALQEQQLPTTRTAASRGNTTETKTTFANQSFEEDGSSYVVEVKPDLKQIPRKKDLSDFPSNGSESLSPEAANRAPIKRPRRRRSSANVTGSTEDIVELAEDEEPYITFGENPRRSRLQVESDSHSDFSSDYESYEDSQDISPRTATRKAQHSAGRNEARKKPSLKPKPAHNNGPQKSAGAEP